MQLTLKSVLLGTALSVAAALPASAVPVDLELSLLIDVSGSVDTTEFNLQKQGYVDAFASAGLWNAISQGEIGAIAVNFIYWSSSNEQSHSVGWTLINSAQAALDFSDAINATSRPYSGLTAPGSAITFAAPLFEGNGFEGTRKVIDVSGDGSVNDGSSTSAASAAFCATGGSINGIPILGSEAGLDAWYAANIQCGPNSFTIAASSFDTFGAAIQSKLQREITNEPGQVPLPAPALMLFTGLGGFAALRRLRKRA